jgi:hypothetical protein
MRFGLAIGTERAKTLEVLTSSTLDLNSISHLSLQSAIQDELIKRGYSAEPGPFLAAFASQETANRALQTQSWQNTSLL